MSHPTVRAPEAGVEADPWAPLLVVMRGVHPEFSGRDLASFKAFLAPDFDVELVVNAVRRLGLAGRKFYPRMTAADVAAECQVMVRPDLAPVSWVELWAAITAARRSLPHGGRPAWQARFVGETVAAQHGAIAGAFAASTFEDLMRAPLDGEQGGKVRASLRREWEDFEEKLRERALRGVPVPSPEQMLLRTGRPRQVVALPDAVRQERLAGGAA